jgi:glycosyltransferase involved in cell wall biosynthesis
VSGGAPHPRRVLCVIPTLGQGGAEQQLAHLAQGLARRGDRVTVACLLRARPEAAARLRAGDVGVLELDAGSRRGKAGTVPRLRRLARDADLVHCGLFDASLYGRLAALAARRPVTVAEHSADRSMQVSAGGANRARVIGWHHRLLAPFTAATLACASSQVPLLRHEGVPAARLALVPNGVPVAALRAVAAERRLSRAELGVPDGAPLLVQVGRLTPEKDQRLTVDAVAALRSDLGDVHAVFVGTGDDEAAPTRARELDADWAHFIGGRDDVPAVLALADVAVLPSLVDTFPMAALEAMAVGVPQVTSDVGDLPAVVAGSGAGVAVPAGDLPDFTAACRQLLVDPARRAAMAASAAESVMRWDVEAMVDRYVEIFEAAVRGAPLPADVRPGPQHGAD